MRVERLTDEEAEVIDKIRAIASDKEVKEYQRISSHVSSAMEEAAHALEEAQLYLESGSDPDEVRRVVETANNALRQLFKG